MKKNKLSSFFTILLMAYPILYIYSSPVSALSLADFLLFVIDIALILELKKNDNMKIAFSRIGLLFITVSIVQILFLIMLYGSDYNKIIMPTLRILFYIFNLCFFGKKYFDIDLAKKTIIILTIISSVYLLIQLFFLKIFHFYLPGTIPFIPKYDQNLASYELNMKLNWQYSYRARSLFIEPSHFAIYSSLGLMVMLNEKKKNYLLIFIVIIAMILSGSSTAILMIPISLFIYLLFHINNVTKKKVFQAMIFSIISIFGLLIYFNTDNYQKFYDRTFVSKGATTNRIENYSLIFSNSEDNTILKVFGHGIYKIDDYIPSIPRIYYYYGMFGLITTILLSIYALIKIHKNSKCILLALIVLCFTSELLFSHFIIPFFSLIFCNYYLEDKKERS